MSSLPESSAPEGAAAQEPVPPAPVAVSGDGVIHEIRWSDALPWWLLFRAAGAAFAPTVIVLAALGALATWAGWSIADRLGIPDGRAVGTLLDAFAAEPPSDAVAAEPSPGQGAAGPLEVFGFRLPGPATDLLRLVSVPLLPRATLGQMAGTLARLAWFVAVWSIFGSAIARHVALRLASEEPAGLPGSLWFGSRHWPSAFGAAALVLAGIFVLSLPAALFGLVMRTDVGLGLAGILWPLVLLGGIVLAILAIGLVAGWPLMVSSVGVERGDAFQAISTAFSYLYQRPLHFAFYALVALVVALPALAAAHLLAVATTNLALWATSLGMGHARTAEVLAGLETAAAGSEVPFGIGALHFWSRGLEALLGSFGWGYFWAIATSAYLLLRRDVDGTELDEVVVEELPGEAG